MTSSHPIRALRRVFRHYAAASGASSAPHSYSSHIFSAIRLGGKYTRTYSTIVQLEDETPTTLPSQKPFARSVQSDLQALENVFALLSTDSRLANQLTSLIKQLERCHRDRGCVFVTGVGKSGIVARRLASSLSSISIRSQWIHGSEWIHGDLGSLQPGDIVIVFSHSGNTSELLSLPRIVSERHGDTIAIVGHQDSPLARACGSAVVVPAQDERDCPVPTRSIIVQDAISNAIIESLVDSIEDRAVHFRANHPGGAIGDRFAGAQVKDSQDL